MRRSVLAVLAVILAGLGAATCLAETGPPSAEITARADAIADAVLSRHVDPPTRQQMILDGLKAVYAAAGAPHPAGLARRVSELSTPDQLPALLAEVWPQSVKKDLKRHTLDDAFLEGMLASIPGASLATTKELKVAEQIEGNLYVGIHIAIGYDDKAEMPVIQQVIEGGPADRAGARAGDRIEEIDGVVTKGMPLGEAVDRLRGEEGTEVVVRLRGKSSKEARTLTMTRGRLPRSTVSGVLKRPDGDWVVRLEGPDPIGYLRVDDIAGSTTQELRQMAPRLESAGVRALIVDLRGLAQPSFHATVLLADCLLDGGTIGRVRTAESVQVYDAEPDALFRDWPLAVLVDDGTSGAAVWLCAALQDNHRAAIVGPSLMADGEVLSTVPLPGGEWSMRMSTGRLERGDGRSLASRLPGLSDVRGPLVPRLGAMRQVEWSLTPDIQVPRRSAPRPRGSLEGPAAPKPQDIATDECVVKARERLVDDLKSRKP